MLLNHPSFPFRIFFFLFFITKVYRHFQNISCLATYKASAFGYKLPKQGTEISKATMTCFGEIFVNKVSIVKISLWMKIPKFKENVLTILRAYDFWKEKKKKLQSNSDTQIQLYFVLLKDWDAAYTRSKLAPVCYYFPYNLTFFKIQITYPISVVCIEMFSSSATSFL